MRVRECKSCGITQFVNQFKRHCDKCYSCIRKEHAAKKAEREKLNDVYVLLIETANYSPGYEFKMKSKLNSKKQVFRFANEEYSELELKYCFNRIFKIKDYG